MDFGPLFCASLFLSVAVFVRRRFLDCCFCLSLFLCHYFVRRVFCATFFSLVSLFERRRFILRGFSTLFFASLFRCTTIHLIQFNCETSCFQFRGVTDMNDSLQVININRSQSSDFLTNFVII